jgi:hypothetical protein
MHVGIVRSVERLSKYLAPYCFIFYYMFLFFTLLHLCLFRSVGHADPALITFALIAMQNSRVSAPLSAGGLTPEGRTGSTSERKPPVAVPGTVVDGQPASLMGGVSETVGALNITEQVGATSRARFHSPLPVGKRAVPQGGQPISGPTAISLCVESPSWPIGQLAHRSVPARPHGQGGANALSCRSW